MGLAAWWARFRRAIPADGWLAGWLGNAGERQAENYLRGLGYRILARRFRFAGGDLDLIALDGDCVVFVEVKTRRSAQHGLPAEAVTPAKQRQLARLALAFLKQHRLLDQSARFDVVAVEWPAGGHTPHLVHYRDAFPAPGRGQWFS